MPGYPGTPERHSKLVTRSPNRPAGRAYAKTGHSADGAWLAVLHSTAAPVTKEGIRRPRSRPCQAHPHLAPAIVLADVAGLIPHAGPMASMAAETEEMRARRHHRRALFDGVADRYQALRREYPPESVRFVIDTARLGPGRAVLEVGCGTGQLTGLLAGHDLAVTAIDIGAGMIAAARQHLGGAPVRLHVASFEEFDAPEGSFDLIISATAFHWVDPAVKFAKPARLLKAGGWLALLDTEERYDDPLGSHLRDMWAARCEHGDALAGQRTPPATDLTGAAGWFGPPVHRSYSQRMLLPAQTVIGLETTRATFLSWPERTQQDFTRDLRRHLRQHADVHLTQQTSLAMARALPRA